jgi:dTDP-4-dehydrorhamnose reductase
MLGHQVVRRLSEDLKVIGTARNVPSAQEFGLPCQWRAWEAVDPGSLDAIVADTRPSCIINCVAVRKAEGIRNPQKMFEVNATMPRAVADLCARWGCRFVHISSDAVFSGTKPFPLAYTEDCSTDATDPYGMSKVLGEPAVEEALTLRTSIVGRELSGSDGLLEWFLRQEGGKVSGFSNSWFSGVTTGFLAEVIHEVVARRSLAGVYHVAGPPTSKYELLLALRSALNLRVSIAASPTPSVNRVLDASRLAVELGITTPSWEQMLVDLVAAES